MASSHGSPNRLFEFVVGDASSQPNQKRIRHHIIQDGWNQRRERAKKAVRPTRSWATSAFITATPNKYLPRLRKDRPQNSKQTHIDDSARCLTPKREPYLSMNFSGYDPFQASIAAVDGRIHSYIVFFATSMWPAYSSRRSATRFLTTFGHMAIHNEALLYAIAASAAARQSSTLCARKRPAIEITPANEVFLIYLNKAMAATRKQIQRNVSGLELDANIGVISFLAMCEAVDFGNMANSQTHITAMLSLIKQRGGCHGISNIWMERIIAADLKAACVSMRSPRLSCLENVQIKNLINEAIQKTWTVNPFILTDQIRSIVSGRCLSFIVDLKQLSLFKGLVSDLETWEDHSASIYRHQRLILEHQILNHISQFSEKEPFEVCLCLGMLLYINSTIWVNFHPSCAILRSPARRLRVMLLEIERVEISLCNPKLSCIQAWEVWLLFMGSLATYNEPERDWFLKRLGLICKKMKLKVVNDLRNVLLGTIYTDTMLDRWVSEIFCEATSMLGQF